MSKAPKDQITLSRLELRVLQLMEKTAQPVRLAYLTDKLGTSSPKAIKAALARLVSSQEIFETVDGAYMFATSISSAGLDR